MFNLFDLVRIGCLIPSNITDCESVTELKLQPCRNMPSVLSNLKIVANIYLQLSPLSQK